MMEGTITERNFPEWSMGFKSVNARELAEFSGYLDPALKDFLSRENSAAVISMLQTFMDTNRMS